MTLVELLTIANKGYPDGYLAELFDPETGDPVPDADEKGDTLALFILREIREVYYSEASRDENLQSAIGVLEVCRRDVDDTIGALEAALYETNTEAPHA